MFLGRPLLGALLALVVLPAYAAGPALLQVAGAKTEEHAQHGHDKAGHDKAGHDHGERISLPAGPAAPSLAVDITKDTLGGWNLHIRASHFRFAPQNVNGPHRDGEGHAHVYVNGEKIARVYGPWFHIGSLPSGTNTVTVTLNANDHRALAVGDAPLAVSKQVHVH